MKNNDSSIGIVKPNSVKFENSLLLECGKQLKGFEMVYETYGELNTDKSNFDQISLKDFDFKVLCCNS